MSMQLPDGSSVTSGTVSKALYTSETEFREEVIYFIIVDRFFDASSDEE